MSTQNETDSMDVDSTQTDDTAANNPKQSDTNETKVTESNPNTAAPLTNGKKPMSAQKKAALQERLKKLVSEYRNIITQGCGNWRCTNPNCKSSNTNKDRIITDADASKLALQMIKQKSKKCIAFPALPIHALQYTHTQLTEEKKELSIDSKQVITDAFTHWDIFDLSFTKDHKVSDADFAIDFVELDKTFAAIMAQDELCKDIASVLEASMDDYLLRIKDNKVELDLNLLRALIILLSCPLILSEDIDCHYLLEKYLVILEMIGEKSFKLIKTMTLWLACASVSVSRLSRALHSLHQYMTLVITMKEDEIEDLTEDWRVELKYDETEDNDERDEISQEIEKKQQSTREKYIIAQIAPVIKLIDIIFNANKTLKNEKKSAKKECKEDESSSDILMFDTAKSHYLKYELFANDGLNEAICSKTLSRSHIHRRDFIHYKEKDFFTFLSYPFLLTAASKSRYLEFENLLRQHRARRRRMFDLMLSGGFGINQINRNQLIEELDLCLRIRRSSIIQDTLGILQLQESQHLRKRLRIIFDGEEGIDQGGLTKEYFQLIMKELFDPNYGMFIYNGDTENYWFNRDSFDIYGQGNENGILENYELVGKLVGIAIYNNTILELRFPRVIFKKLLNQACEITFSDFKDYDPEMAKGFEQMLSYDEQSGVNIEDVYCRNFLIKYTNIFGQEKCHDLLGENGKLNKGEQTALNSANKHKYVDLYIKYILIGSIAKQFNAFLRGFKAVCDSELFNKYTYSELELLICGSMHFDFDALESTTKYEDGLHKNSRIVKQFWLVAHQLTDENKRKLLTFCTGSDRVPINGLGELTLTISKNGNDNSKLPTSHTCFNHLLLPEYSTKEILETRLLTAIQNSEGFGLL